MKHDTCDAPPDREIAIVLPDDLLHFARACAGDDDISECVATALELLRAKLGELASIDQAPH